MKVYNGIGELVGRTPLVRLKRIEETLGLSAKLYAKLEGKNPAGSAKDRVAKYIIDAAERDGRLLPGGTIIEPTSGNTGIGIAAIAASRGYRAIIVMPSSMSEERKKLIRAYGAELVETDAKEGMLGSIRMAEELSATIPGSIIAGQFTNPENPRAHREMTGPEIYEDTDGTVDIFVAGIGTGGTITGVGEYIKSVKPECEIVGIEPRESAVLTGGEAGPHGIQGIGAGFIPEILNRDVIDRIATVSLDDAVRAVKLCRDCEGILIGISSGAALHQAIAEASGTKARDKNIVVLFPDSGERYLSGDLFN